MSDEMLAGYTEVRNIQLLIEKIDNILFEEDFENCGGYIP